MTGSVREMRAEGPTVDSETAEPADEAPGFDVDEGLRVMPTEPRDLCALAEFKPMSEITCDITVKGDKPRECPLPSGQRPDLVSRGWAPVTFTWNTTGFTKGNYTLSVHIHPVPDETNATDNTLIDGWVFVTISGDVDGDRDVDIFDIVRMAGVYGIIYPDPRYDPDCDIDSDGDIDIFDLVRAAGHYGDSW